MRERRAESDGEKARRRPREREGKMEREKVTA
jgi:hypothetical protein